MEVGRINQLTVRVVKRDELPVKVPVKSPEPLDTMDDDLKRLCMSMFALIKRKHPRVWRDWLIEAKSL
jgi:hypothetical protein